jgi:hypothetical protein
VEEKENYRTFLEMGGGEGKLKNNSGDECRRGKTTEHFWRWEEERGNYRTFLEMSGGVKNYRTLLEGSGGETSSKTLLEGSGGGGNISWIYKRWVEERNTAKIY